MTARLDPCVVPASPSWLADANTYTLPHDLGRLALAARDQPPGAYLLDSSAYRIAGETIQTLHAAYSETADSPVRMVHLPVYRLTALHRVRAAVRRAINRDDEAKRVLDTLQNLQEWLGRVPEALAVSLDRVLAVLALDTPAVQTLIVANITGHRGPDWRTAYEEVVEDWRAAGVAP